ncbi:MAG: ATP-binding protein [Candidatus Omnitrophica bacterium]|nr:ATP-binding protein [Candidatus Omnitrophota bacterium]
MEPAEREQLERKTTEAEFVAKLLGLLITQKSCLNAWRELLDECVGFTHSSFGILGIINEDGSFDISAVSGADWQSLNVPREQLWQSLTGFTLQGIWAEVIRSNQIIVKNENPGLPWPPELFPRASFTMHSFLGLPFSDTAERAYGMLALANKPGGFSPQDSQVISRVAQALMLMMLRRKTELDLRRTNQALERSNRDLDDFTHSVSHDLKEPLRGINAFSKFLREDYGERLDEKGRHYLTTIENATLRMKRLIDDLLELSRVRRRPNPWQPVLARELIDEVVQTLEFSVKEKKAEIAVADSLPVIACDRARYRQVFYNLIVNALKYSGDKQPRIEIGCEDAAGEYVFFVRDNGIGIPREYFEKIFLIFQRLSRDDADGGTGAGLTIVKTIVEMHGGRIWVESELGKGSTFYFTYPQSHKEKFTCPVERCQEA